MEEVNEALERSAGFVIGSPTLGGHMSTQVLCMQVAMLGLAGQHSWQRHRLLHALVSGRDTDCFTL